MKVGDRITKLRKELKLSQGSLAKKLGIPQTTLSNYEIGIREVGNEVLVKFAEFFNVSVDYLLGLTKYKQNTSAYNNIFVESDNARITNGELLDKLNMLTAEKKDFINKMVDFISN